MNSGLFAPNRGIGTPLYFTKVVVSGVLLCLLMVVVASISVAESLRFDAPLPAVMPANPEVEAAQHFAAGLSLAIAAILVIFAAIIFGIGFFQRAVDAGQSAWVGFFCGLTAFITCALLSLSALEIMNGRAITAPRLMGCLFGSLLLSLPTLFLGALRSCQCPPRNPAV